MTEKPLGLYVHIPFCVRKCAYCDFLSAPASEEEKERYVNILCEEIEREAVRYPGYFGETVFFGGGTPTTLKAEQLEEILCKLKMHFGRKSPRKAEKNPVEENSLEGNLAEGSQTGTDSVWKTAVRRSGEDMEVTLECNPGTVAKADLWRLRAAGFNRLSIGLQSAQDEELRRLGRIHTWEEFLETYRAAREAGFQNINVDLMSALPGQSVESYVNSLEQVAALYPEHISAYSLIIEEGTLFYERYGEADEQRRRDGADREHLLPTEEEERRMYALTREILERRGYRRYEISNYALPGFECRHNITYWRRGDYLGFGLGAASLMENKRFSRSRDLREYGALPQGSGSDAEKPKEQCARKGGTARTERSGLDAHTLSIQEQMEEFMFLGLRLTDGISPAVFWDCFQVPIEDVYGNALCKLKQQGFLVWERDRICLTERGIDVSNIVLVEFLL